MPTVKCVEASHADANRQSKAMQRRNRLLIITFIESFATILLERGVYFYTKDILHFSELQNLLIALMFGILYIIGALNSHKIATRWTEKRVLLASITGLTIIAAILSLIALPLLFVISFAIIGILTGIKWPIIESYIHAGLTPTSTLRATGRFSISWALAVPLSLAASGLLIGSPYAQSIFIAALICHIASLFLCRPLIRHPIHLPHDHPEQADPHRLARYTKLLLASRWSMLSSYTLLFLLAPLMPSIFADLGFDVQYAAAYSGFLDVTRLLAFFILGAWVGWHGKVFPILLAIIALPCGFIMILLGNHVTWVIVGELLFGVSAGLTYYSSLYYAMVVKNASVDAGGAHEGLIGAGFAIGPLIGILGIILSNTMSSRYGILVAAIPFFVLCMVTALLPILHLRASAHSSHPS
ncbi:MFS transporter [Poriferisphaera sp. WC338]|uniref:MFS transporter n=1 Tax=Poriferisphaera sp. WC338 TaxID=3425129 RepID=UPI003D81AD06